MSMAAWRCNYMASLELIEEQLLFPDGSLRDINFVNPTWDGVIDLLNWFCKNYQITRAYTGEGTDFKTDFEKCETFKLIVPLEEDSINVVGEDSDFVVKGLLIFVGNRDDEAPFVELTFGPEDLTNFSVATFVQFVEELRQILQASWYYVKYEDASWEFGSTGETSPVIFEYGDVKDI